MNRKTPPLLRTFLRIPVLYQFAAFLTARRVRIVGRSMLPALSPGERVLFDRLAYRLDGPRLGDVVLARHPAPPGVRLIKRVAEQEGLAPDEFWLLGDNAEESTDSRTLGPFSREDIRARAWVVYWPPERFHIL
ncbi:MAG: nickel-type superoxide dismutase maturation protease [Chloroflexi bacterium]|nr:MAG: nickel-type superoxide dismutase maturation protease [Chloroflexota bacterium]